MNITSRVFVAASLIPLVLIGCLALAENYCPTACRCNSTQVNCEYAGFLNVPRQLPNDTSVLVLANNEITTLYGHQLYGLANLTFLDLGSNSLTELSPKAFEGCCGQLQTLILFNNSISFVSSQVFFGLQSLRVLDLHSNNMIEVPDLGGSCPRLEKLDLGDNFLTSVKFPASYNVSLALTYVNVQQNQKLTRLGTGDFDSLCNSSLQFLVFQDCALMTVEPRSLSAVAANLDSLWIDRNQLGKIGVQNVTEELREAKRLSSLNFNKVNLEVRHVTGGLLSALGTSGVQELHLSHNWIPAIRRGAFRNLPNLTKLFLVGNGLMHLSYDAFDGLLFLDTLILANNNLFGLKLEFPPNITLLDLRGNNIKVLSNDVFLNLRKLSQLILRQNELLFIHNSAFQDLDSLTLLDISGNLLTALSWKVLEPLKCLTMLNVSYNRIVSQCEALISSQNRLTTLDLSHNLLTTINSSLFLGMNMLKYLNLSQNYLSACFDYSYCGTDLFRTISSVTEIDLSDNQLYSLPPGLFKDLSDLQTLKLSSNELLTWDDLDLFHGDTSLKTLLLDRNLISILNITSFAGLTALSSVDLDFNPLACTCDMVWFRKWVNQTDIKLVHLANYLCHSPTDTAGKHFLEFDAENIVCTNPPLLLIIILPSCIFSLLIALLLVSYRYRWKLRFKLYLAMKILSHGQEPVGYEALAGCNIRYTSYISHCRQNVCRKVVLETIMPMIDDASDIGNHGKFIVHVSDKFDPSKSDIANIVDAVESSALFVVFLCKHYRNTRVCELELELAMISNILAVSDRNMSLNEGVSRLVVVAVGECSAEQVPSAIRPAFERGHYLQWSDDENSKVLFWANFMDLLGATGFPPKHLHSNGNAVYSC